MILIPVFEHSQFKNLNSFDFSSYSKIVIAILYEGRVDRELISKLQLNSSVKLTTYEEASSNINQARISKIAVDIVSKIKFDDYYYGHLFNTLGNMSSLYIHQAVYKLIMLDKLVETRKFNKVVVFGDRNLSFDFPERVDVKTLYHWESSIIPLVNYYLHIKGIVAENIPIKFKFKLKVEHFIRRLLLNGYKFITLLKRKIGLLFSRKSTDLINSWLDSSNNVAIIIRAQSEYWTVKPLLNQLKKDGFNPIIIQDDLIKNPSSKKTLDNDAAEYISIHDDISFFHIIYYWLKYSFNFFFAKYHIARLAKTDDVDSILAEVFLNRRFYPTWMSSTLHSLPEISLFEKEVKAILKKYNVKFLITMDMVDQWSAVIGNIGRELGVKSLIIQNTVLDDIIYFKPVASDYIAVSGRHSKSLLSRSGVDKSSILDIGLPIFDDIFKHSTMHTGMINEQCNIVVATQPFVQEFDFNRQLICDLVDILDKYNKKITLIIKPHPRESSEKYQLLVKTIECSNVSIVVNNLDNILLLAKDCDIFISRTSTAIQSFILLGRVCISYLDNYPKEICSRLDYLSSDACLKAYNKKELESVFEDIFSNSGRVYGLFKEDRDAYIKESIGQFDGKSSKRISQFISNNIDG